MSLREFDLRALLAGDASAEARFLAELKDLVFRIARRQYRFSQSDAEDLLAQILEKLWKNDREALRIWRNDSPLDIYLGVVANRFCLMRLRSAKRSLETAGDTELAAFPEAEPLDALEAKQRWHKCREALMGLTERDRRIIEMRYLSGLDYDEIVARLGLTHGAARKALHSALERLRNGLRRLAPEYFER